MLWGILPSEWGLLLVLGKPRASKTKKEGRRRYGVPPAQPPDGGDAVSVW